MYALVVEEFGAHDTIKRLSVPDPEPGPGEVAIRTAAAAINFPDLLVVAGKYQVRPALPFIPGKELAGEVTAIGKGVVGLKPGDRVMAQLEYGAFAESVIAPESACFPVPASISLANASVIGIAYQTAHFALHRRGNLRRGQRLLVTGASGSVGIAAIQLAKAAGAHVVGVINRTSRAAGVLDAGCDAVVLFEDSTDRDAFRQEVRAAAGGDVDLLVDMVGGDTFGAALRCVGWEGAAVIVGFTSGDVLQIKSNYLLVKNIAVVGLQWSDYRDRDPDLVAHVQDEIFALITSGVFKVPPPVSFPAERHGEAFDRLSSRNVTSKIVLDFTTPPASV